MEQKRERYQLTALAKEGQRLCLTGLGNYAIPAAVRRLSRVSMRSIAS